MKKTLLFEKMRYHKPILTTIACTCERGFNVSLDGVTEEDGQWSN